MSGRRYISGLGQPRPLVVGGLLASAGLAWWWTVVRCALNDVRG